MENSSNQCSVSIDKKPHHSTVCSTEPAEFIKPDPLQVETRRSVFSQHMLISNSGMPVLAFSYRFLRTNSFDWTGVYFLSRGNVVTNAEDILACVMCIHTIPHTLY